MERFLLHIRESVAARRAFCSGRASGSCSFGPWSPSFLSFAAEPPTRMTGVPSQESRTPRRSAPPPSPPPRPPRSEPLPALLFFLFFIVSLCFLNILFFLSSSGGGCLHGLSVSVHWAPPLLKCPSPSLWTVCSSHWLLDLSLTLWVFNWL